MKGFTLVVVLFICCKLLPAQTFHGRLLNQIDSSAMPFAIVKCIENGEQTATNEKAEFQLQIPTGATSIHFEISFVGCHATLVYKPVSTANHLVYAACSQTTLKDIEIEGLSAKEVVRRAVAAIPKNYSDSSYAAHSFYRQYEKINGVYNNLIEAQCAIMFNLNSNAKEIKAKEAFAIKEIRRSNYVETPGSREDDMGDLFNQNPIYHIEQSSISSKALDFCTFRFDTAIVSDKYIIHYQCTNFSTENHGISNYENQDFNGESFESGTLTIDKESLAIIKIERRTFRNKSYHYPKNNNFILPDLKYTEEFKEGSLVATYEKKGTKWFLKQLLRSYTNEFYRTGTYEKAYTITTNFEWHCVQTTRFIDQNLLNKFYFNTNIHYFKYTYHPQQWQSNIPDFHFCNQKDVWNDIGKMQQPEMQFEKNGN